MLAYLIDFRRQLTVSTLSGGLPIKSSKSGLLLFVLGPSRILGTVVLSGANCRHRLSKRILEVPMKAQHFARNILAAAVLSALGAHAAVAADFSEGVYEPASRQKITQGSSSKTPVAKPDGTKMFCSAFLNDARMCCFFCQYNSKILT